MIKKLGLKTIFQKEFDEFLLGGINAGAAKLSQSLTDSTVIRLVGTHNLFGWFSILTTPSEARHN